MAVKTLLSSEKKHTILFLSALLLMLSTLFLPSLVENDKKMAHVEFGYPAPFVYADFSSNSSVTFFPRYQKLELNNIAEFSITGAVTNLVVSFVFFELIIYILENIKYHTRKETEPVR